MKQLKLMAMALVAALAFTACDSDDPDEPIIDPVIYPDMLVLNNGNWGANDANVLAHFSEDDGFVANIFAEVNGRQMGDLGQDMVVVGDEIYVAMNGSQVIYVTDKLMQVKHEIVATAGDMKLSPRYFCVAGDKVYVTYYEGFLGEINTKDYTVRTTAVGNSPEGLAYVGGKVFVANSGGALYPNYENTISVVDAAKFVEEEKIEVNLNPQMIVASTDGTTLYVNSFGDYAAVPAMLQTVSVASHKVSDLQYTDVKGICAGPADVLYVVTGSYNDQWQVTGTVNVYDTKAGADKGALFAEPVANYYSVSYSNGCVFVGASDYTTNGDVYVYDTKGQLLKHFDSQGLNPIKGVKL